MMLGVQRYEEVRRIPSFFEKKEVFLIIFTTFASSHHQNRQGLVPVSLLMIS
jgi:hypothetical protein